MSDRRRPCRLCGKRVTYREHPAHPGETDNRRTYAHKCEHGNWCLAGDRLHSGAHASACCPAGQYDAPAVTTDEERTP